MNIQSLVSYLKDAQFSNGSFENSPFQTSLILICLEHMKHVAPVQLVARKAVSYLLSQSSLKGSWNYWDRSNPRATTLPDDLDDTIMALTAISIHAPDLVTEEALLSLVQLLVQSEVREGGPYFTWIVPSHLREEWDDVDSGVNSTIHYLLTLHNIHLEPLENFLLSTIGNGPASSKYYKPLHLSFFLSRHQSLGKKSVMMQILTRTYPTITTILDRSLFTIAYMNLGGKPDRIAHDITKLSRIKPKHLDADPFFIEEVKDGIPSYTGSRPLTAAFIISALKKYEIVTKNTSIKEASHHQQIHEVIHGAQQRFVSTTTHMQQQLKYLLEKMSARTTAPEIFLLPLLWYESLYPRYQKTISRDEVLLLCCAQVLGWIGFTVYDDIIDGEPKQELLPLANKCVREMGELFRETSDAISYQKTLQILDGIDTANLWEYNHCVSVIGNIVTLPRSLPDYKNLEHLANKSLGHAIGAVIISPHAKKGVLKFFTHYLIARQLNDDAHDWLADLEQGILTPVSVLVIKKFLTIHPAKTHIDLETDRELLQSIFWHEVIDTVVTTIQTHTKQARALLKKTHLLKNNSIATLLITPLEESATKALTERNKTIRFLEKYH